MNFLRRTRTPSIDRVPRVDPPGNPVDPRYQPPIVLSPGRVRRVTLGSSSSGNADANSQYYW